MFFLITSENILSLVCWLGVLQGVLFAAMLYFHPKSDRSVSIFLALHVLLTATIMTLPFIIRMLGWQNSAMLLQIPFLGGPFIYLYLRSFKERITWKKASPHFILFVVFVLLSYINISNLSTKYPDANQPPPEVLSNPLTIFISYAKPVQQLFYYFLCRKVLLSYQRSIQHLFSETSRIGLPWGKLLINGFLILVVAFVIIFPLLLKFPEQFTILLLINMAIATPYIYLITYKGIMQPSIWQLQPDVTKEIVEDEIHQAEELDTTDAKKAKAVKPGLNEERLEELVQGITSQMEQEKLYQETELTLRQLAAKLGAPVYQVSQALNDGMKKNFYDLINGYRVEEAKRLLLDAGNRNYTILSIAFEAGFNSKTTFNTVFKKFTGLTPTEFREQKRVLV